MVWGGVTALADLVPGERFPERLWERGDRSQAPREAKPLPSDPGQTPGRVWAALKPSLNPGGL